jgi:cephalosporin hydroxylase
MTQLDVYVDTGATLATFSFARGHGNILKHPADLDRYAKVIADTAPEVIVECGTWAGASARWFAEQGIDVISIDLHSQPVQVRAGEPGPKEIRQEGPITWIEGDSVDAGNIGGIRALVNGRRCMVSLDSNHTAAHVKREIDLYGPLVSPGCYLVVEDGIFRFATPAQWRRNGFGDPGLGTPLDAIESRLVGDPAWRRDIDIEQLHALSHHPGGWWVRQP